MVFCSFLSIMLLSAILNASPAISIDFIPNLAACFSIQAIIENGG